MSYIGDLNYESTAVFWLSSVGTDGQPATLTGGAAEVMRRDGWPWMNRGVDVVNAAGVTVEADVDGMVGANVVKVDMAGLSDYYLDMAEYEVWMTAGTAGGRSYATALIGQFSLGRHKPEPIRVLTPSAGGGWGG